MSVVWRGRWDSAQDGGEGSFPAVCKDQRQNSQQLASTAWLAGCERREVLAGCTNLSTHSDGLGAQNFPLLGSDSLIG